MTDGNTPILSLHNISKHFDGLQVLDDVSFDVHGGATLGLIGPNGAGKTTLFNIISGLLQPSSGEVMFDGRRLNMLSPAARSRLGMVRTFQKSLIFPEFSVIRNVAMAMRAVNGKGYHWRGGKAALQEADRQAAALLQGNSLASLGHEPAAALSYGQQRLLDILIALAQRPRLLLLDEPSAGLSGQEAEAVFQLVHQQHAHTAIVLIAHDIDIVFRECDRIAVLNLGRLVTIDTPEAVRSHEGARVAYLGELASPS